MESLWLSIGKFVVQLFINKEREKKGKIANTEIAVKVPFNAGAEAVKPEVRNDSDYHNPSIDWTDPKCQVTAHFTVGDCLMLHSWNRLANPEEDGVTDGGKSKLITTCQMMEKIRMVLGCPINIHCIYRSPDYNAQVVKAIPNDVHAQYEAADWDALPYYSIEEAKEKIRPHLEEFGIRMEAETTTWIHNDWHKVGPSGREFKA